MAKRKATETEVIDVGTVPEDQALIASTGGILATWVGNVQAFLQQARALEVKAGALETTAGTLKQPTTATADAELQRFIQTANATAKELGAHWSIAQSVHQFHKLLVGYRERGASKAERAAAVAQRLHNAYTQAEARRVAEENARRQREAEAEAQRKREAEVAELERRAVEAEAASEDLSARERVYVERMATGTRSIDAARAAGYKDPATACGRLAGSPKIQKAIMSTIDAIAARAHAVAVQAKPLEVAPIEQAVKNVTKIGSDRTTRRGELLDLESLLTAFLGCKPADYTNKYGIPADLFTIDQAKLTHYARNATTVAKGWPGVRVVESTTTV